MASFEKCSRNLAVGFENFKSHSEQRAIAWTTYAVVITNTGTFDFYMKDAFAPTRNREISLKKTDILLKHNKKYGVHKLVF